MAPSACSDRHDAIVARSAATRAGADQDLTLARVATALDRHLVPSFPEKVPAKLKDAVQVA